MLGHDIVHKYDLSQLTFLHLDTALHFAHSPDT